MQAGGRTMTRLIGGHKKQTGKTVLRWTLFILAAAGLIPRAAADSTWEFAVQLSAVVQESPPQITLNWVQDSIATPISYTVYRKALTDTSWGTGTVLPGEATSFVDNNVALGTAYEYQVFKQASGYVGYGYLYSGIDVPLVESRGTVLLIVDDTYSADLAGPLALLQQDLVGDGWNVVRQDFARTAAVTDVKAFITAEYNSDPANVNTVFLFGHVPVAYSGDIYPDEHPEHQGAWPADVYYGNLAGPWTDDSVYDTSATDSRNWNVPGDGKFDQSVIPSLVNLMVGRVDLADLPGEQSPAGSPTFPSELDLLRNYLSKDHAFREGMMSLPRRGLIADFFGDAQGYAYSASGWRNFAPFFGPQNIMYLSGAGTWLSTLSGNAFLCAYGCGPGQYNSISGLGTSGTYNLATTTDLVEADPQAAFFLLFGSWLGDWDSQDDFMRAVLATPTYGLACGWSGSPHWFCQHMALGKTIGFSTRRTQNNAPTGLYQTETNTYAGLVHIALMGDPTLRLHPVGPPDNVSASGVAGSVQVTWSASSDNILGYHVYRATDPNGPYTRLTGSLVSGNSFMDGSAAAGAYTYMVRAVKLEVSPSGSYYNPSQGAFVNLSVSSGSNPVPVRVTSVSMGASGITLSWPTTAGSVYQVQFTADLAHPGWIGLSGNLTAQGSSLSWTDNGASGASHRFYRVVSE